MAKVGAIVLNWNNYDETSRCLRSLREPASRVSARIWVVDNGSRDGSGERLKKDHPEAAVVLNGSNLGFACGVNAGLKAAFAAGCDQFLLVNNDVEVGAGSLDRAVAILEGDPGVGIVTGKLLGRGTGGRILHAGGVIDPAEARGISRGFGEKDGGQYDEACDTGWASCTFCLISLRTIERIGILPDVYFFGHEEYEYSTRTLKAGLRIVYCPDMRAEHLDAASHDVRHPVLMVYNHVLSKFIYARRNLSEGAQRRLAARYFLYLLTVWPLAPSRARLGCRTWRDYKCRYKAAWLAFLDRKRHDRTTLELLVTAQGRIGASDTWGASWGRS